MFSAACLGLAWIQVAYLGHDSGHHQALATRGWNKIAGILIGNCTTGISIAWWKWTHNAHHLACNSLDHDPDLQHLPMLAISSSLFQSLTSEFYERKLTFDPVAKFFISYQHLSYYPVMCVARVDLYLQTLLLLCSKRKTLLLLFPLLVSCLPSWTERMMFVLVSFCVCAVQHVHFTLNHFEKQAEGTINIICYPWMDWSYGGLQFLLEHHLFPRLPRCNLRSASPLIKDLCKKHNLPYRCPNVMTVKTLRTAALQASGFAMGSCQNPCFRILSSGSCQFVKQIQFVFLLAGAIRGGLCFFSGFSVAIQFSVSPGYANFMYEFLYTTTVI